MLDIAHDCFQAADKAWLSEVDKNSGLDQDERWLHHYMLGKVAEKRGQPIGISFISFQKIFDFNYSNFYLYDHTLVISLEGKIESFQFTLRDISVRNSMNLKLLWSFR